MQPISPCQVIKMITFEWKQNKPNLFKKKKHFWLADFREWAWNKIIFLHVKNYINPWQKQKTH